MEYEKTHPWLTFKLDARKIPPQTWVLLGEAQSKIEHLAHSPLPPESSKELHAVYTAKGILATTAIEGNTLSEDEVLAIINKERKLPPSKEYLEREVQNILDAFNDMLSDLPKDDGKLSVEFLNSFNEKILRNLEVEEGVMPGALRTHGIRVGSYRGAPEDDLPYLMGKFIEALNEFPIREGQESIYALLKAIFAHLYLVWIHPYGDGNGRTARLLEVKILLCAGVPSSAAHLLSNHYNETRGEYYRQLERASRSGGGEGDIVPFITYAIQGFVDQIRKQIEFVQSKQLDTVWVNYIHEFFRDHSTPDGDRRRNLILGISKFGPDPYLQRRDNDEILKKDLEFLVGQNLLEKTEKGYFPNKKLLTKLLPIRKRNIRA